MIPGPKTAPRRATIRKVIPDAGAFNRRPFVVETDKPSRVVVFEADGQSHRIGSDEARRIGRALLKVASLIDGPDPDAIDDVDDLDDDLPEAS